VTANAGTTTLRLQSRLLASTTPQNSRALLLQAKDSIRVLNNSLSSERRERLKELDKELQGADSWEKAAGTSGIRREHARLSSQFARVVQLERSLKDVEELLEIAESEKDAQLQSACVLDLERLASEARSTEIDALLNGPAVGF